MRNYVNENGFSHARLTSWGETGAASVKGAWSPDCAGSYTEMPD